MWRLWGSVTPNGRTATSHLWDRMKACVCSARIHSRIGTSRDVGRVRANLTQYMNSAPRPPGPRRPRAGTIQSRRVDPAGARGQVMSRAGGEAVVSLRDIGKGFPGVTALDGVDLDLHAGTVHALVGENGAGKSTLINILSGVFPPDRGDYLFAGRPVRWADARAARAAGIATVHQEADLFPDLTVAENVAWEHGWPTRRG